MNYADALEHQASVKRGSGSKAKLSRMTIEPAENGGHIVEHHMSSSGGAFHEPETHVFAKGEGAKMLAHVSEHLEIGKTKSEVESEEPAKEAGEAEA